MAAPTPRMHGLTHVPGGPDPIPGLSVSGGDYATTVLAIPGLYGYWRLGEDTGDTFADTSGHGHNLTRVNPTGVNTYPMTRNVTGALTSGDDGAAEFNITPGETSAQSDGEWLEDTAAAVGPGGTPLTACGWIKCKANAATMHDGVAFGTAGQGTGPSNVGWGFCVTWPALTLRYMQGNTFTLAGGSLTAGAWYFVCMTDDGTTERLYVNAAQVASAASTPPGTPDRMRIGYGMRAGGSYQFRPFFGTVDEVAVWTRALTPAEVSTVYTAGITDSTGLVPGTDYATPAQLSAKVDRDAVEAATNRLVAVKLAAGDAQPAFKIAGDGGMVWGPGGTTAPDTNLFRASGSVLKTVGQFYATSYIAAFQGTVNETTFGPARIILGGDTTLYRALAGFLKTDTNMSVAGDMYVERDVGAANKSALNVFFSGAGMRLLEVGPADSAGAGFRTVRVPN